MRYTAEELRSIVKMYEAKFLRMEDDEMARKSAPGKWSKKELLGHLIDSPANNHQRFVRAVKDAAVDFPTYDQNDWVETQRYNERPWPGLVALWSAYNDHLAHLIDCIPKNAASFQCNIGEEGFVSLEFAIEDYVRHLRHHIGDILDERT